MNKTNTLNIMPIGGIEEIGKNTTLYQANNETAIIVDCGLKFASPFREPGADNVFIDYKYLEKYRKKVKAIVITHAHLDHIGGIPYLLEYINATIYCSRFTKGMIELILSNYPKKLRPKYQLIKPNLKYDIGELSVEFIGATHSIVESFALCIDTPCGKVLHTGDYRIDDDSAEENKTDLKRIAELGRDGGYLALLSDSTNSMVLKQDMTEQKVVNEIEQVIKETKGRIIISCFSTQVIRIQMLLDVCKKLDKKVFFAGRSLQNMIELATEMKMIKNQELFVTQEQVKNINKENLIVFTTGTQGEPTAGLNLMAHDKHKFIKLDKDDTILMSSSVIPGNEVRVGTMFNQLIKKKLKIITYKMRPIHVSGHGSRSEITKMIETVIPKYFIPIHGEAVHLNGSREAAMALGMPDENIIICENGHNLCFTNGNLKAVEKHKLKNMMKDGKLLNVTNQELFDERQIMWESGAINIAVIKNGAKIKSIIKTKGFISRTDNKYILDRFKEVVEKHLEAHFADKDITEKEVVGLKKTVNNFLFQHTGKKPVVFYSIIDNNEFK